MSLQKIEHLIEKYEKGTSSSDEEKQLMAYFLKEEVPPHLKSFKALFTYYYNSKKEKLSSLDFDEKVLSATVDAKVIPIDSGNRSKLYFISTIAAGILILFGLYFRYGATDSSLKDTYNDPALAYAETKKILMRISVNMNSGVDEMKSIKEFNEGLKTLDNVGAFQTGLNHLEKVSILEKTKEIITTKNN
jgi:hypothetical protein